VIKESLKRFLTVTDSFSDPETNHRGLIIDIVTGDNSKSLGAYLVSGSQRNTVGKLTRHVWVEECNGNRVKVEEKDIFKGSRDVEEDDTI